MDKTRSIKIKSSKIFTWKGNILHCMKDMFNDIKVWFWYYQDKWSLILRTFQRPIHICMYDLLNSLNLLLATLIYSSICFNPLWIKLMLCVRFEEVKMNSSWILNNIKDSVLIIETNSCFGIYCGGQSKNYGTCPECKFYFGAAWGSVVFAATLTAAQ